MEPTRLPHAPHPLAPDAQTACYSPWLKVRVLIRTALTMPWSPADWPEIRQHLKWLLAEEARLQREAQRPWRLISTQSIEAAPGTHWKLGTKALTRALCSLLVLWLSGCASDSQGQSPQRSAATRQACDFGWYWDSRDARCRPIESISPSAAPARTSKPTDGRPACPFGMYWDSLAEKCLSMSAWAQPQEVEPRVPPTAPNPSRKETPNSGTLVGTAFGVAPEGLMLTAFHLVSDARSIRVFCPGGPGGPGGPGMEGRVVRASPNLDLALVRVAGQTPGFLRLANTRTLQIGDSIFTVGYPVPQLLGRDPKFTEGVVSALSAVGREDALFQMTVPIQPGNSGGAVLNNEGKVVGVVVSTVAVETFISRTGTLPQNVNWAVKAEYATLFFEPPTGEARPRTRRQAIDDALRATCMLEAEK
ncbi:MAG: hypothetical protein HW376_1634 [candidate division NC10 bacterium]|nr:hypothetical protein [candidate division NC10 bacterium]